MRPQRLFLRLRFLPLLRCACPPWERRTLPSFESFMRLTAHFFVFILGILSFLSFLTVRAAKEARSRRNRRVVYRKSAEEVKRGSVFRLSPRTGIGRRELLLGLVAQVRALTPRTSSRFQPFPSAQRLVADRAPPTPANFRLLTRRTPASLCRTPMNTAAFSPSSLLGYNSFFFTLTSNFASELTRIVFASFIRSSRR